MPFLLHNINVRYSRDGTLAPMSPLLTLIALLLPTYLIRFHVFGVPTTVLEVLVLVTVAAAIITGLRSTKRRENTKNSQAPFAVYRLPFPWLLSITLFLLAGTIAIFVAPNTRAALGLWKAYIIEPVLLFFIAIAFLRTDRDRRRVVIALVLGGLFVAVIGIWQKFFPDGVAGLWPIYHSTSNMEWYEQATRRVTGVYSFPNAVGLFLAPIAVLLRGLLIHSVRRFTDGRRKIDRVQFGLFLALTAASILMVFAVYFARSHGALLGIVAGIIVLGVLSEHWRRLTLKLLALLAILFVLILPFQQLVLEEFGARDPSLAIRRKQYKETLRCLTRSPTTFVFGGGLSGYKQLVAPCHKAKVIEIFQYPHNVILNFWSEMGLLGLLSFAAIVLLFFRQGVLFVFSARKSRTRDPDVFQPNPIALPIALLGAMTALLIHGLVDVPYFKNDLAVLFWLLGALMLCSTETFQAEQRKTDKKGPAALPPGAAGRRDGDDHSDAA
jgi:O-antigen ligase